MEHTAGTADTLAEVAVGDDPAGWAGIGFSVADDGTCQVGSVAIRLVGTAGGRGRGIVGWGLSDLTVVGDIDGLPTSTATPASRPPGDAARGEVHPNGVTRIDHLVVITPDLDRTTGVVESLGIGVRRTREAGRGRLQRFFRLGEVILEVVGPVRPVGEGPATFWGLAFTVTDLDATVDLLGDRVGAPRDAVQEGRRIVSLPTDDAVSVPIAFMSPAPGRGDG
jgi:hypothetical protein